jgi:hypothetical protein
MRTLLLVFAYDCRQNQKKIILRFVCFDPILARHSTTFNVFIINIYNDKAKPHVIAICAYYFRSFVFTYCNHLSLFIYGFTIFYFIVFSIDLNIWLVVFFLLYHQILFSVK